MVPIHCVFDERNAFAFGGLGKDQAGPAGFKWDLVEYLNQLRQSYDRQQIEYKPKRA